MRILRYLINSENLTQPQAEEVKAEYASAGREAMEAMARQKKILPFAAQAFASLHLDEEYWQKISEEYRRRNTCILQALSEAYTALHRNGVKKMFVSENFGALLSAKGDISLFASGDVDNYGDPEEKEKIYAAFEELGYTRKERFAGKHQISAKFFPPKEMGLPEKFYIGVDFYPLARLKLPCFIHADDFVDWDKLYCYAGTEISLAPPTALMYICLLHISLHSFSRAPDIRLYTDLVNMSNTSVDYERIAAWCHRDRTCTRASVAATLANQLMGTAIPAGVTELTNRKNRVEALVYDSKNNDLIYEPHGLKVLRIETRCNDISDMAGLWEILFPPKDFLQKVYGSSGIAAHLKHFKRVL